MNNQHLHRVGIGRVEVTGPERPVC